MYNSQKELELFAEGIADSLLQKVKDEKRTIVLYMIGSIFVIACIFCLALFLFIYGLSLDGTYLNLYNSNQSIFNNIIYT